ncbi:hypothetical protein K2X33_16165 [bacterium]|nr:hypothetical protein [bacterium]
MWIFGSFPKDLAWLVLPGALGILFAWTLPAESTAQAGFLFAAFVLLDSGHVYTTLLRTYFHRAEVQSTRWYAALPFVVAAFFFTWAVLGIPYLWAFVIYATLFHNIRQFYGVLRWYQKLEKNPRNSSRYFLYALTFGPVVLYHFRPGAQAGYYTARDIFLYPDALLYHWGLAAYAATLCAWVLSETAHAVRNKKCNWGSLLAIATPATLYGVCMLLGNSPAEILGPLVIAHGIGYFGLLSLSLQRTQPKRYARPWLALAAVVIIAWTCGPLEYYLEEHVISFGGSSLTLSNVLPSLWIGLYLVPLFSHFIIDAYIWKGTHREAKLVYVK